MVLCAAASLICLPARPSSTRCGLGSSSCSCLEIPHHSHRPQLRGGGWLFASLSPSFIAGGGSLENIQLFTVQLMHTVSWGLWVSQKGVLRESMKVSCMVMAAGQEEGRSLTDAVTSAAQPRSLRSKNLVCSPILLTQTQQGFLQ